MLKNKRINSKTQSIEIRTEIRIEKNNIKINKTKANCCKILINIENSVNTN